MQRRRRRAPSVGSTSAGDELTQELTHPVLAEEPADRVGPQLRPVDGSCIDRCVDGGAVLAVVLGDVGHGCVLSASDGELKAGQLGQVLLNLSVVGDVESHLL